MLSLAHTSTTIIAVRDNSTKMAVYPQDLGIEAVEVRSYLEAVGVLAGMKAGIDPFRMTNQTPVSLSVNLEKETLLLK